MEFKGKTSCFVFGYTQNYQCRFNFTWFANYLVINSVLPRIFPFPSSFYTPLKKQQLVAKSLEPIPRLKWSWSHNSFPPSVIQCCASSSHVQHDACPSLGFSSYMIFRHLKTCWRLNVECPPKTKNNLLAPLSCYLRRLGDWHAIPTGANEFLFEFIHRINVTAWLWHNLLHSSRESASRHNRLVSSESLSSLKTWFLLRTLTAFETQPFAFNSSSVQVGYPYSTPVYFSTPSEISSCLAIYSYWNNLISSTPTRSQSDLATNSISCFITSRRSSYPTTLSHLPMSNLKSGENKTTWKLIVSLWIGRTTQPAIRLA